MQTVELAPAPDLGLPSKFVVGHTGLELSGKPTLAEWQKAGLYIATAMRSVAFVVGDWLIAAEQMPDLFGETGGPKKELSRTVMEEAVRITGIDYSTLHNYAYVARQVPPGIRTEWLSWEHHRRVAKLKSDSEKDKWLLLAADAKRQGEPISTRRLARSIAAGRLLSIEEMLQDPADRRTENVAPYVQGIVTFFAKLREAKWFDGVHREQLLALSRDIKPVVDLYDRLLEEARMK